MRVIWADRAVDDLTEIVDYIRADSPEAARRVASRILDAVSTLRKSPYIGRKRLTDDCRELVFAPWPYSAIYEVIGEVVYIQGIRHTSRNWSL